MRRGCCSSGPPRAAAGPGAAHRRSADPLRSRVVAGCVVGGRRSRCSLGLRQAMRVPRIRRVDVAIDGLGARAGRPARRDDHRYALRTDRSLRVGRRASSQSVNELDADIVCHVGDIADGTVDVREHQARPLASVRPRRRGCTSPATTSTSARRRAGSTTWRASAGRHCTTGTSSSSAGVTASSSPVWTTPPPGRPASAGTALNLRLRPRGRRSRAAGAAARASTQAGAARVRAGVASADLRSHSRRPDLAVQLPGPARSARGARTEPARRRLSCTRAAERVLGSALSGVRAERDHAADPS